MPDARNAAIIKIPKPGRKGLRRLLLILLFLSAAVLVVLFFTSSLTKIDSIEIRGTRYATMQQIGEATGVKIGDHFFAASSQTIKHRIEKLPTVKSADVSKKFPGIVHIAVYEFEAVALQLSPEGIRTILLANGTMVEEVDQSVMLNKPILTGWKDGNELVLKLCAVLDTIAIELLSDISEIKPDPSNVYPDKIKIYTRSKFEVTTTIGYLPDKIDYMRAIIAEEEPGILVMLEANYRAPYDKDKLPEEESTPEPE